MKRSGKGGRHLLAAFAGTLLALLLSPLPGLVGTTHASLRIPPAKHVVTSARAAETEEGAPFEQSRLASAAVAKLPRAPRPPAARPPGGWSRRTDVASLRVHRPKIPSRTDQSADPH